MIEKENRRRTLLEAGTEGGSVGVAEDRAQGKLMFVSFVYDCTNEFLNDSDHDAFPSSVSAEVNHESLAEALRHLDQYSWWSFSPLEIAPDCRSVIKDVLVRKGVDLQTSLWKFHLG